MMELYNYNFLKIYCSFLS